MVHNLLMQFFTAGSSKIEVFETCFFDIVITQNDHPSYVKHILACIYIVFPLFRVCVACGRLGVNSLRGGLASQRLLDQSQAGIYMGKTPHTPHFWPFWAYSRTLPQGIELLVYLLVKSLFCPIKASPNEFLVQTPPDPPHLKPTFWSL